MSGLDPPRTIFPSSEERRPVPLPPALSEVLLLSCANRGANSAAAGGGTADG